MSNNMTSANMNSFFLILILYTSSEAFHNISSAIDDCIAKFNIQYCSTEKNDSNILWHLSKIVNQHFTVVSQLPCANLGFSFRWIIKDFDSYQLVAEYKKYMNRSVLFINATSFPAQPYILELNITHPQTTRSKFIQCFIRMKPGHFVIYYQDPVFPPFQSKAVLSIPNSCKDGRKITYFFTCDNYRSHYTKNDTDEHRDCDLQPEPDQQTFTLRWEKGTPFEAFITIPYVSDGELTVSCRKVIRISSENRNRDISIFCRQNCYLQKQFYLLPNVATRFEAECIGDVCDKVSNFVWNVTNADQKPVGSRNSTIELTGLDDSDESWAYYLPVAKDVHDNVVKDVYYDERKMYTLTYKTVLSDCKVFPDDIYPIITVASVKCKKIHRNKYVRPRWRDITIKVVELINGTFPLTLSRNIVPDFLIRFGSAIPAYEVMNATLDTVRMKSLDIQVHKTVPPEYGDIFTLATNIYHKRVNGCQWPGDLGKEGRVWEAVQVINSLMSKLLEEETESWMQFNINLSTTLLGDMLMFPTNMVLDSLIFVLLRLMRPVDEPKQLDYSLELSNVCNHLAAKLNEELYSDNRYFNNTVAFKAYTVLTQCDSYLMAYNYQNNNQTELYDVSRYRAITKNIIAMTRTLSLTQFALRGISLSSRAPFIGGAYFVQHTTVSTVQRTIYLERCSIELPPNIGFNDEEIVTIVVNSFNEDVFYLYNITQSLNTKVVKLSIGGIEKNVTHFSSEADVFLSAATTPSFDKPVENTISTEKSSLYNDTNIPVFIIEKINSNSLIITMTNISEPVRVVLFDEKRPVLSDFETSQPIVNQTSIQVGTSDQDGWIFLGILPETAFSHMKQNFLSHSDVNLKSKSFVDMLALNNNETVMEDPINKSEKVTADINLTLQRCFQWKNGHWDHLDCKVGPQSTSSVIHCKCYSLDNVGGFSMAPNLKRRDILVLSLAFAYHPNYIPVILLNLILACYCITMCFTLIRGSFKEQIYYLGDNLHTQNYAYFIAAKTSGKSFSGTTANIVIQLFGEKAKSRPHVLNYPDPDQNLLQRGNKDYFILTTRQHLGALKRIRMWSDCLQLRPTWRCDYVKICDLQTKTWYIFNVNTLFSPLKNGKHFVSVMGGEMTHKYHKRITLATLIGKFLPGIGQKHSWNIISRKNDRIFGYEEKLTVMLCCITSSCSAALWICSNPTFRVSDAIFNNENIKENIIYLKSVIVSCIVFSVNRIFVVTFKNLNRNVGYRYSYRKRKIPEHCKFVCWVFMILLIIANTLYVLCMGSGTSQRASYVWLLVTFLSLVISIIIWENLCSSICKIMKLKNKPKAIYHYDKIIKESQNQKEYLKQVIPGHYSLRPYLVHLYTPMNAERYHRKRDEIYYRMKIAKTFRDFCFFLLYFALLYCLVAINLDSQRILLNNHMKKMIHGDLDLNRRSVQSRKQFLAYLNNTLTTTIHSPAWYGAYTMGKERLLRDFQTKMLGVIRIRQQRVTTTTCQASEFCNTIFGITHCASQYISSYEDYQNYSHSTPIWEYKTPRETGYTTYSGEFATYYGGGFITYTGVTLPETKKNIMDMVREKWLDKLTRAILIEFWVYNANRNLFSIVTLTFEFSATGYVHKSHVIYSTTLLYGNIEQEVASIAIFAIFFFVIMYQLGSLMYDIVTQKTKFWGIFSNWFFCIVWIANAIVIGLNIRRQTVIENILNDLATKEEGEFTPYFDAEYICAAYTTTIAVLMCASVLGTWRFLRFGFTFGVFEHTIRKLTVHLISVVLYSIIVYFKYSIICNTLFGSYVWIFRNVLSSAKVITLLSLKLYKGYNHEEIEAPLPVASKLFYCAYNLTLIFILTVYISIIMQNYKISKEEVSNKPPQISIFSYFKEECLYQFAYFKRKKKYLTAGESDDKYLYDRPKAINRIDSQEEGDGLINVPSNKFELMAIMLFANIYNKSLRIDTGVVRSDDIHIMQSAIWYFQHMEEGEQLPYYQMKISENNSHFMSKGDLDELTALATRLCDPEDFSEDRLHKQRIRSITDKISLKKLSLIADSLRVADALLQNIHVKKSSDLN